MDPGVWDNPHEFIPERFLDHDGQFDDAKESFIPFGIGEFIVYCKLLVGSQYTSFSLICDREQVDHAKQNPNFTMHTSSNLHECSCFVVFIKRVGENDKI